MAGVQIDDLEAKLDSLLRQNETLERENALYESYLLQVGAEPELDAEGNPVPSEEPVSDGGEVSLEQKTDIAHQTADDLKQEIAELKHEGEKLVGQLRAVMEECGMRKEQVEKDLYEFKRDVVTNGANPRTGKIQGEKVVRYFEEKLRSKGARVEKLRLKNAALRNNIQKLDRQLGEKEEMGEVLNVIDFDQLKIENQQYLQKIREKNKELVDFKKTSGKTVQALNEMKLTLNALTGQQQTLHAAAVDREQLLGVAATEVRKMEDQVARSRRGNDEFKRQQQEIRMPEVLDYVQLRVEEDELLKEVEELTRKNALAARAAKTARLQMSGTTGRRL